MIGKWIRSFLTNRKFRVVVNGCMSDEGKVMSGVPQGTVLAAILFVIMISDLDKIVKICILRSSAEDTRVSKKYHLQWRQTTDTERPEVNI